MDNLDKVQIDFLLLRLDELEMRNDVMGLLQTHGFQYVYEIVQKTEEELGSFKGIGPGAVRSIKGSLFEGFRLGTWLGIPEDVSIAHAREILSGQRARSPKLPAVAIPSTRVELFEAFAEEALGREAVRTLSQSVLRDAFNKAEPRMALAMNQRVDDVLADESRVRDTRGVPHILGLIREQLSSQNRTKAGVTELFKRTLSADNNLRVDLYKIFRQSTLEVLPEALRSGYQQLFEQHNSL